MVSERAVRLLLTLVALWLALGPARSTQAQRARPTSLTLRLDRCTSPWLAHDRLFRALSLEAESVGLELSVHLGEANPDRRVELDCPDSQDPDLVRAAVRAQGRELVRAMSLGDVAEPLRVRVLAMALAQMLTDVETEANAIPATSVSPTHASSAPEAPSESTASELALDPPAPRTRGSAIARLSSPLRPPAAAPRDVRLVSAMSGAVDATSAPLSGQVFAGAAVELAANAGWESASVGFGGAASILSTQVSRPLGVVDLVVVSLAVFGEGFARFDWLELGARAELRPGFLVSVGRASNADALASSPLDFVLDVRVVGSVRASLSADWFLRLDVGALLVASGVVVRVGGEDVLQWSAALPSARVALGATF